MTRHLLCLGVFLVGCGPRSIDAIPIPIADPRTALDPINVADPGALHVRATRVLEELVAALPDRHRRRVAAVTLIGDNALGDVNAYATCGEAGPVVAISDGLLVVAAHLAMSTAADELFETERAAAYLDWLSRHGITPPPVEFYPADAHTDRRKVARQHELFDEQVAFVLGHELAHHYLGHLPCTGGHPLEELARAATEIPVFNQLAEHASDLAAVKNVLAAGDRRRGYPWTEDGALLVIAAFNRVRELSFVDALRGFERTHPFPHLRAPAIVLAAEQWHISGGLLPLI